MKSNSKDALNQAAEASSGDLQLAFDVGHSSIGWAVLQAPPKGRPDDVNLLGCGVVTFRADDCLASSRRAYRRQRRHIRATRQRIRRLKALLLHLGVLTQKELDKPGCAWPWLLAARVLKSSATGKPQLLTWPELWDVLRWYAHNRGYDGNALWSGNVDSDDIGDVEKVKKANQLMRDHQTSTMAETVCAVLDLDPFGIKKSACIRPDDRFKAQNAAFPRVTIVEEVRQILLRHCGKLLKLNAQFIECLIENASAIMLDQKKMPRRFRGGLLFGQSLPRFNNRIIATCPITFAEEYQRLIADGVSSKEAAVHAERKAKVPSKNRPEFLEFRWALKLADVEVGDDQSRDFRKLTSDERLRIDTRVRGLGFLKVEKDTINPNTGLLKLGKNEFRDIIVEETRCTRHNIDMLMLAPDAK